MPLTKDEIKKQRRYFLSNSEKVTTIKKGDKRIASATRICVVCHRPLSKLVRSNGSVIATVNHYTCALSALVKVNMCEDIRSCYSNSGGNGND